MTKEEAKKMGATHVDSYGDWWKVNGDIAFFMYRDESKWYRYAFTDIQHHIMRGSLEPL